MIHVLVAEDSVTTRELLVEILHSDAEVRVVGEAKNGIEALEMARRLRPDVVTMDIRMPVMDGFEATKRIMIEAPTPIVIVSASLDVREVEISMHALRVGALAVLPKPPGPGAPDFEDASRRFIATVKAMAGVKVVRRRLGRGRLEPVPEAPAARNGARARIVALAASTGGPAALHRVLSELPGELSVPILVVQHIASGFIQGLASWLNTVSPLKVKVAENGEPPAPGTVYLAPDSHHLGVSDRNTVLLSTAAPIKGFRPSATFLFQSVGQVFGTSAVALVLTGMGEDGVEGLRAFRNAGGRVVAQDEASSVVYGMPGAAVAAGFVDVSLPLAAIPSQLVDIISRE